MNAPISYGAAWAVMAWFILKDAAFTILGAFIAPRIYCAVTSATNKRIAA